MTTQEIKNTAFGKWLLSQSREEALLHVWECLLTGPTGNLAWDLWKAVHGSAKVPGKHVEKSLGEMLDALEAA